MRLRNSYKATEQSIRAEQTTPAHAFIKRPEVLVASGSTLLLFLLAILLQAGTTPTQAQAGQVDADQTTSLAPSEETKAVTSVDVQSSGSANLNLSTSSYQSTSSDSSNSSNPSAPSQNQSSTTLTVNGQEVPVDESGSVEFHSGNTSVNVSVSTSNSSQVSGQEDGM